MGDTRDASEISRLQGGDPTATVLAGCSYQLVQCSLTFPQSPMKLVTRALIKGLDDRYNPGVYSCDGSLLR